MDIQIGAEYLLNISKDVSDEKIDYLGKITAPRYLKWGEISGKRILIKSKLTVMTDYFEATLVSDVTNTFYVTKKMLSLVPRLVIKCKCAIRQLFARGCRCGAFKREMEIRG